MTTNRGQTRRIRRARVGVAASLVAALAVGGYALSAGSGSGPSQERASIRQLDPDRLTPDPDLGTGLEDQPGPDGLPAPEPDPSPPSTPLDGSPEPVTPQAVVTGVSSRGSDRDSVGGPADATGAAQLVVMAPTPVRPSGSDPASPVVNPGWSVVGPPPAGSIEPTRPRTAELPDLSDAGPGPLLDPAVFIEVPEVTVLDLDQRNCPNLGLVAIGDAPEGDDFLASFHEAFRAMAGAELTRPLLVCAQPMKRWEDLVVQELTVEGRPDSMLATAGDHSGPVLKLTFPEWEMFLLREADSAGNLLGFPLARTRAGGADVVLTSHGAVVTAAIGSKPLPLIGGIWDLWLASGGADGPMGLPESFPHGSTWSDPVTGEPVTGAVQAFSNGWARLPGVLTAREAAAQPAEAYEWLPHPPAEDLTRFRGHIIEVENSNLTYYVDHDGIRHWIPTSSDWMCARWDLGAEPIVVSGHVAGQLPLGEEFVCPTP